MHLKSPPAPVALFVYNRPEHFDRVLKGLAENPLAKETDLFIFSDAPKKPEAAATVQAVREKARRVTGFQSVKLITRDVNFGLAKSIISGVTELLNEHERIIVLEDDLLTSPLFLTYMNTALEQYAEDERVVSIHGYAPSFKKTVPDFFFLRGADCWGWATWRRGWNLFEPDGKKLLDALYSRGLSWSFDLNGAYPFMRLLHDFLNGKNNSWAIRWQASAFILNKFTLHSAKTFVKNIGFDGSGTHCDTNDLFQSEFAQSVPEQFNIPVEHNEQAFEAYREFFLSSSRAPFLRIAKGRLNNFRRGFMY